MTHKDRMNEKQMLQAFGEVTVEHAKDGLDMGLNPVGVSDVLVLAAFRLMQDYRGSVFAVACLQRALTSLKQEAGLG